jgi:uncharacterized protein with PIN domain
MSSESRKRATAAREDLIRRKSGNLERAAPPRFVADVMLGKLAKWLRIAGFDVLYSNRFNDDELLELASRDGRILLSRDTRLLVRRSVRLFIFLESEKVQDQIRHVFRSIGISVLPGLLTRCIRCNTVLLEIPTEEVRNLVPPYVFRTQVAFKFCRQCSKIYWAGTHRQSVLRTLEKLL